MSLCILFWNTTLAEATSHFITFIFLYEMKTNKCEIVTVNIIIQKKNGNKEIKIKYASSKLLQTPILIQWFNASIDGLILACVKDCVHCGRHNEGEDLTCTITKETVMFQFNVTKCSEQSDVLRMIKLSN